MRAGSRSPDLSHQPKVTREMRAAPPINAALGAAPRVGVHGKREGLV